MKKYEHLIYSAVGLVALVLLLIAFNYLASTASARVDLTEGNLYTLSEGTKKILRALESPVTVKLYVSQGETVPVQLRSFAQRVEDLVREFQAASNGNLRVQRYNPKPDSDEEDAAQLDGIEPQQLVSGEQFYLGVAVSQLERKQAIAAITPQRERLLEYDLVRAIARVGSAARPKIADYPFTTLVPTLGLVRLDEERTFVIADVPGLIPGAAEGKGLGLRFLRHLERTRLLVHLLDLDPATGRDPVDDWRTIQAELETYSPELAARPQLIVANKTDLPDTAERLARVAEFGRRRGLPVVPVAARTGQGLAALRDAIGTALPVAAPPAGAPA